MSRGGGVTLDQFESKVPQSGQVLIGGGGVTLDQLKSKVPQSDQVFLFKGRYSGLTCRVMKTKGMVFRYTWVYSKEDTMAHTRRPMVTS